jgi:hypothetical protein
MSVSPLPLRGGVHFDKRDAGRALRVSAHPDSWTVTLSIWRGDFCVGTHQMNVADVPELIEVLARTLVSSAAL